MTQLKQESENRQAKIKHLEMALQTLHLCREKESDQLQVKALHAKNEKDQVRSELTLSRSRMIALEEALRNKEFEMSQLGTELNQSLVREREIQERSTILQFESQSQSSEIKDQNDKVLGTSTFQRLSPFPFYWKTEVF